MLMERQLERIMLQSLTLQESNLMTAAWIIVSLDPRQVNEPRRSTDKLFPVPVSHGFCHWHTPRPLD